MFRNFKTGTYAGTGAAVTLELGFVPDFFVVWNETDSDAMWFWGRGMTAANALAVNTAVAALSSNGVTTYTGAVGSASAGLTLGTTLSENGKTHRYIAFGAD